MFGREQLERNTVKKWLHSEWEIIPDENGEFFWADDVNNVLDKMESRIKELKSDLSTMETSYEFLIKNTVKVLKNTELQLQNRIKELETENEKLEDDWQKAYCNECVTRHENHRLVEHIEELEAENEKLKPEYAYYYVAYTVNEYGKQDIVPKYFHTIDEAKEEMKYHSNFYEAKGTGFIYGVKFTVPVETVCVFEK